MNFREFYELHEAKHYVLMKDKKGKYSVLGPRTIEELPTTMKNAREANKPAAMWTYNISGARLNLPPEIEHDKERILQAHYGRLGLDRPELPPITPDPGEGDIIEPSVFDPEYGRKGWKQYAQEPATASFHPQTASGSKTIG